MLRMEWRERLNGFVLCKKMRNYWEKKLEREPGKSHFAATPASVYAVSFLYRIILSFIPASQNSYLLSFGWSCFWALCFCFKPFMPFPFLSSLSSLSHFFQWNTLSCGVNGVLTLKLFSHLILLLKGLLKGTFTHLSCNFVFGKLLELMGFFVFPHFIYPPWLLSVVFVLFILLCGVPSIIFPPSIPVVVHVSVLIFWVLMFLTVFSLLFTL